MFCWVPNSQVKNDFFVFSRAQKYVLSFIWPLHISKRSLLDKRSRSRWLFSSPYASPKSVTVLMSFKVNADVPSLLRTSTLWMERELLFSRDFFTVLRDEIYTFGFSSLGFHFNILITHKFLRYKIYLILQHWDLVFIEPLKNMKLTVLCSNYRWVVRSVSF